MARLRNSSGKNKVFNWIFYRKGTIEMKDVHIHIDRGTCDSPETFLDKTGRAGVDGGVLLSLEPYGSAVLPDMDQRWQKRLDFVLDYTSKTPGFVPFFYIDPMEIDAEKQVIAAKEAGIAGFKMIADHYYPEQTVDICNLIASFRLPVLFHSGILWTIHSQTACYNRPACFEPLSRCKNLTFALAHISWPWNDECLAVYGKFAAMRVLGREMPHLYIDLTPGTPRIYREEALRKLYYTGYSLEKDILWGTDLVVNHYDTARAQKMIAFDNEIYERLATGFERYLELDRPDVKSEDFSRWKQLAFEENFHRFLAGE